MNKETHTPKILFTDMDGTLLLSDSTVSPVMKETLNRLTEAGHKLVLTSGRPPGQHPGGHGGRRPVLSGNPDYFQ